MRHTKFDLPVVGISQCLLGEAVRYDGGNKYHDAIDKYIKPFVQMRSFCPEVAAGLGVPRQPVRLERVNHQIKAVGVTQKNLDVTQALAAASKDFIGRQAVLTPRLCAYVFKARSPSCGLGSTPVYEANTNLATTSANGLFAECLTTRLSGLVTAEEDDLEYEENCWRFLSACYLNWRCQQGGTLDAAFERLISNSTTATTLWPYALNQPLVHQQIEANKKAVPWERLFSYWRERLLTI